jgi:hypothetical protein
MIDAAVDHAGCHCACRSADIRSVTVHITDSEWRIRYT